MRCWGAWTWASARPGYPFGSPLLPFNVLFGVRQALGLAAPPPARFTRTVTVERRVAVAAPPARSQVQLEVSAPGFQPQSVTAMVTPGQTTPVQVTLEPLPAVIAPTPSAPPAPLRIQAGRVVPSGPIGFVDETEGTEPLLTAAAQLALNELALQLTAPGAPAQIRIEAHWDSSLPRAEAEALTRRQAEAVAAYLVERGVPRERLQHRRPGRDPPQGPQPRPHLAAEEPPGGAGRWTLIQPSGAVVVVDGGSAFFRRSVSRSRNRSGASETWARFSSKRRRSSAIRPPAAAPAAHQRQDVLQAEARKHEGAAHAEDGERRQRAQPRPHQAVPAQLVQVDAEGHRGGVLALGHDQRLDPGDRPEGVAAGKVERTGQPRPQTAGPLPLHPIAVVPPHDHQLLAQEAVHGPLDWLGWTGDLPGKHDLGAAQRPRQRAAVLGVNLAAAVLGQGAAQAGGRQARLLPQSQQVLLGQARRRVLAAARIGALRLQLRGAPEDQFDVKPVELAGGHRRSVYGPEWRSASL